MATTTQDAIELVMLAFPGAEIVSVNEVGSEERPRETDRPCGCAAAA